jgi:hypothetical protein
MKLRSLFAMRVALDPIVLGVVWGITLLHIFLLIPILQMYDQFWELEEVCMTLWIEVVVFSILLPLHVDFRLAGFVHDLAQRDRREELAVTLVSPKEYLVGKLKEPFIKMVAPYVSLYPLLAFIILVAASRLRAGDEAFWPMALALFAIACYTASACLIALAGTCDLLVRACRHGDSHPLQLVAQFFWLIAPFILPPLAVFALPGLIVLLFILFSYLLSLTNIGFFTQFFYGEYFAFYPATIICVLGLFGLLRKLRWGRWLMSFYLKPFFLHLIVVGVISIGILLLDSIAPAAGFRGLLNNFPLVVLYSGLCCYSLTPIIFSMWLFDWRFFRAWRNYFKFE